MVLSFKASKTAIRLKTQLNWKFHRGSVFTNEERISADYMERENSNFESDRANDMFITVNFIILCGYFSIFVSVTNVIILLVFYRLGLHNTTNIIFFAMAVSGLFSLVFHLVY